MNRLMKLTRDGQTAYVEPDSDGHREFLAAGWSEAKGTKDEARDGDKDGRARIAAAARANQPEPDADKAGYTGPPITLPKGHRQ